MGLDLERAAVDDVTHRRGGMGIRGGRRGGGTGSGGVPWTWSPLDDSSVLVDLHASHGVDATSVGTWTSRVGSVAITQGTGSAKPTQTTHASWGNRTVLSFDGGDYLQNTSITAITAPFTIYVVIRIAVAATTYFFTDLSLRAVHSAGSTWRWQYQAAASLVGAATGTVPVALCVTQAASGNTCDLYVTDFATASASGAAADTHSATHLTIGARDDASSKLTGEIGEVIIASGLHDAALRAQYRSYITSEWGV